MPAQKWNSFSVLITETDLIPLRTENSSVHLRPSYIFKFETVKEIELESNINDPFVSPSFWFVWLSSSSLPVCQLNPCKIWVERKTADLTIASLVVLLCPSLLCDRLSVHLWSRGQGTLTTCRKTVDWLTNNRNKVVLYQLVNLISSEVQTDVFFLLFFICVTQVVSFCRC